jgi:hypothetical protein
VREPTKIKIHFYNGNIQYFFISSIPYRRGKMGIAVGLKGKAVFKSPWSGLEI